MSKIIGVSEGENQNQEFFPVARLINQLMQEQKHSKEDESAFQQLFMDHIEKESYDSIFFLCVDKKNLVVQHAKKDKVEMYFATLIYLLNHMQSLAKMEAAIDKIVELLIETAESPEHASMRLRLLMTAYNIIPVTPKTSHLSKSMFDAALKYAVKHDLFIEFVPYLPFVEEWIAGWGLGDAYYKDLYYIVANELPKLDLDSKKVSPFDWLRKYISVETEVNDKSIQAIKIFFQQVVKIPDVYQVESLLELSLLKEGAKKDATVKVICEALQLFVDGDMDTWEAFKKKNPNFLKFLAEMNLTEEQLVKKLRVLTLCSLATGREQVPLDEIRAKLKLQDVDDLLIEACHYGVLNARIDEVNQVFIVETVLQRKFGLPEWQKLSGLLKNWSNKIKELRSIHGEIAKANAGA